MQVSLSAKIGGFSKENIASIICTFSNINWWLWSRCLLIIYMFVPLASCWYYTSLESLGARLWLAVHGAIQPLLHVCISQRLIYLLASGYMFALHSTGPQHLVWPWPGLISEKPICPICAQKSFLLIKLAPLQTQHFINSVAQLQQLIKLDLCSSRLLNQGFD